MPSKPSQADLDLYQSIFEYIAKNHGVSYAAVQNEFGYHERRQLMRCLTNMEKNGYIIGHCQPHPRHIRAKYGLYAIRSPQRIVINNWMESPIPTHEILLGRAANA